MTQKSEAELLEHLLQHYSFELGGLRPNEWVAEWRDRYPEHWLRSAIVEALYQGRYKVVSVVQILDMWERRGQSVCHYNGEFERMVCNRFLPLTFSEPAADSSSEPFSRRLIAEAEPLAESPSSTEPSPSDRHHSWSHRVTEPQANAADAESHRAESPNLKSLQEDSPDAENSEAEAAVAQSSPSAPLAESLPLKHQEPQISTLEPEISLLEDEFLEIFAVESNPFQDSSIPPQAIPPFKPSADVPVGASRFADEPIVNHHDNSHDTSDDITSTDVYRKLKAALNRVVSTATSAEDNGPH